MLKLGKKWQLVAGAAAVAAAAAAATIALRNAPNDAPQASSGNTQDRSAQASPSPGVTDACPSGKPLDASQISGDWIDGKSGTPVSITQKNKDDPNSFIFKGDHDWDGTYANGILTLKRKPIASEMSRDGPDWARQSVQGQVEWRMELKAQMVDGARDLCGPWYPGRVKVVEQNQSGGGDTVSRGGSASVDGDGNPVTMHYGPGPRTILMAQGVKSRILVDKFYTGIPLRVGLYFEKPYDKADYPVSIDSSGQTINLTAHADDDKHQLFVTDVFVVDPAGGKE